MDAWINSMGPVVAPWATFFAVVMALYGTFILRSIRRTEIYRRLRGISDSTPKADLKNASQRNTGFQVRWLQPVGEKILPPDEWQRSALRKKLMMAGHRSESSVYVFLGAKIFGSLILTGLVFVAYVVTGNYFLILTPTALSALIFAALFGFILPDLEVRQATARRKLLFTEGFPDALDMLVVCVEAGLGLDSAIDRVATEMRISHPALASELALISLEVRAGKTRKEALQSLADRTGVPQVQTLTTLLIQAERFGTSVAAALRDYSEEMRTERLQTAREKAAKLPVRLIFPIVVFIFPALFLVILGPALIQMMDGFGNVL